MYKFWSLNLSLSNYLKVFFIFLRTWNVEDWPIAQFTFEVKRGQSAVRIDAQKVGISIGKYAYAARFPVTANTRVKEQDRGHGFTAVPGTRISNR